MNQRIVIPIIVTALVAAVGVGFLSYQAVKAEVPAINHSADVLFDRGGNPDRDGIHLEKGELQEYLADALGISVEELEAAFQEAHQAAIEQAVEKGLVTQEEADRILEDGHEIPIIQRLFVLRGSGEVDHDPLLADVLGISVDELEAAYTEAFTAMINRAVSDEMITQERADLMIGRYILRQNSDFQAAMKSAYEAAVQKSQQDGILSQAQSDQLLQNQPGGMGFGSRMGLEFPGGGFGHFPHGGEWGKHFEQHVESGSTP